MSFRRFLLTHPPLNDRAVITGGEAFHLSKVLRAKPGMKVEMMDGLGKVWSGIVKAVGSEEVEVEQLVLLAETGIGILTIDLILALSKTEKLEWIFQKTTEIGIDHIHLLDAERSVVKLPPERVQSKLDRWEKIVQAAAKQSHRTTIPCLHPPARLLPLLPTIKASLKLMLSEQPTATPIKTLLQKGNWDSVCLSIGPEGGWTPREERQFRDAGFLPASLGKNILRMETAAVVATTILQYELGDRSDEVGRAGVTSQESET